MSHRYICEVVRVLNDPKYENCQIYHNSNPRDPKTFLNSVVLVNLFQIAILWWSAEKSWDPFYQYEHDFITYWDASSGPCTYQLKAFEVVKGFEIALKLGWYNYEKFDHLEYEYFEWV